MEKPKPKMTIKWEHSIKNPANEEYVNEVAFNLNKKLNKVTQEEFNDRYSIKKDTNYYNITPKKVKIRFKK
jgi:hypothetical protein